MSLSTVTKPTGQYPQLEEILIKLKAYLNKVYQEQLAKVILYGSQARGEALSDSDIDVLIVLKNEFTLHQEIEKILVFVSDLCLDYDLLVSCVFTTLEILDNCQNGFYLNVRKEGIEL